MATSDLFIHPSLAFIAAALILPFMPGKNGVWRKILLLLPPLIAIYAAFANAPGAYMKVAWLGQTLILGRVDSMSAIFVQVFSVMSLGGFIFALHVDDRPQQAAALLYVAGGLGCVLAGDYLTLFAFWELMALGSTFLVMLGRTRETVLAAFRYFLYHVLGGLFLLGGLVIRHRYTGSFEFGPIAAAGAGYYDWLILLGFCVNAAVVPLHAWLPDAYPRGTVSGSVFMCAYTTKTAVYVLMRGFAGWEILAAAGAVMAVYGVFYASMENNARRILSYHIVSQVGYMVAGIGVGTAMTINGAAAHAYAHILYKGLLFMTAGAVLYSAGTARLNELGGLAGRLPYVMILYMAAALSISGLPLFNGFISKTMTIAGAAEAHRTLVAAALEIAAVGTFISVGLKLPYFAFWGGKPLDMKRELKPIPANMYVAMAFLAALCLAQGLWPEMLYRFLPFPMEGTAVSPWLTAEQLRGLAAEDIVVYHPWALWNVLQALMLLGFSGLAFYLTRRVIVPHAGLNLDFDWFYRLTGRGVLGFVCRPAAFIDGFWTNVYQTAGLRLLKLSAMIAVFWDRWIIDGLVDNAAYGVRGLGRAGALLQNGRLQHYLGLMVVAISLILALVWYF
ncbi:MAG: Na(+)/H(+) antiporter subunit D [Candidatus Adiutrix sp.]|jgi:multicomponent Na+:H+ antiporter subunit D|nr:Na(+)/H(+) antiporter subunit D [Candidatus Adiutrix sp.]